MRRAVDAIAKPLAGGTAAGVWGRSALSECSLLGRGPREEGPGGCAESRSAVSKVYPLFVFVKNSPHCSSTVQSTLQPIFQTVTGRYSSRTHVLPPNLTPDSHGPTPHARVSRRPPPEAGLRDACLADARPPCFASSHVSAIRATTATTTESCPKVLSALPQAG